ncbi:MAG: PaaI family thioesterase [Nocardia sp.]|nr:PaaI family thioesterase [Nocardia sp.]
MRHDRDTAAVDDFNRVHGAFTSYLGIEYDEVSPDRVVAHWRADPRLHQRHGIVHGGVMCSVVESLASVGPQVWFGDRGRVVGVSNSTDFYRPVRETDVRSVATPVHRGRLQQVWVVEIRDDQDELVARGQVRLQNLPADPAT